MYKGLLHFHSYWAYLALAALVIATVYSIYSLVNKKPFTKQSKTITMLGLMFTHIQMVLGFILYFVSPFGVKNFSGDAMKDSSARLLMLEHPLMMIIGITLITIGYSQAKRAKEDHTKFKKISIFYTLGIILIFARIPWTNWLG